VLSYICGGQRKPGVFAILDVGERPIQQRQNGVQPEATLLELGFPILSMIQLRQAGQDGYPSFSMLGIFSNINMPNGSFTNEWQFSTSHGPICFSKCSAQCFGKMMVVRG